MRATDPVEALVLLCLALETLDKIHAQPIDEVVGLEGDISPCHGVLTFVVKRILKLEGDVAFNALVAKGIFGADPLELDSVVKAQIALHDCGNSSSLVRWILRSNESKW